MACEEAGCLFIKSMILLPYLGTEADSAVVYQERSLPLTRSCTGFNQHDVHFYKNAIIPKKWFFKQYSALRR